MVSDEEAREVNRTEERRTALEQLARLHGERIVTHRRVLNPGEVVHGTADAFFLQLALEHGREAGEGILFVTSDGLVWASEQWPGGYRWPKTEIGSAKVRRCPRSWHGHRLHPRRQRRQMRLLHLKVESTEMDEMDLMADRLVIADAERSLDGEPPELSLRLWRVEWAEAGATFVVAQQTGGEEPVIKATLDAELDYEPGSRPRTCSWIRRGASCERASGLRLRSTTSGRARIGCRSSAGPHRSPFPEHPTKPEHASGSDGRPRGPGSLGPGSVVAQVAPRFGLQTACYDDSGFPIATATATTPTRVSNPARPRFGRGPGSRHSACRLRHRPGRVEVELVVGDAGAPGRLR